MASSVRKPVMPTPAITGKQQCRCEILVEKRMCRKIYCLSASLFLISFGLPMGTEPYSTFPILLEIVVMGMYQRHIISIKGKNITPERIQWEKREFESYNLVHKLQGAWNDIAEFVPATRSALARDSLNFLADKVASNSEDRTVNFLVNRFLNYRFENDKIQNNLLQGEFWKSHLLLMFQTDELMCTVLLCSIVGVHKRLELKELLAWLRLKPLPSPAPPLPAPKNHQSGQGFECTCNTIGLQDDSLWTSFFLYLAAFPGNTNSDSVVRHDLQHLVIARYVRIVPLDWNGEGQIGLRIEVYGCSYWADVINFDGHVVLPYRFRNKKMKTLKDVISLKFKTSESEGVIFHGEGQQGDYITLELKKGKLVLNLNLGSNQLGSIYGHTSVMTGSLLDDHHWHSIIIERHGRNINLTLDRHVQHFRTNGEFDYLDLDYEITFGGMPFSGKPSSNSRKNFKGCMESINYNGNNITDLAKRKKLEPSNVGNLSFSCVEPHTVPVFFNATSYLEVPGRPSQDLFSVSFLFRTWNPNGLLVFSNFADDLGNVEININEGKVSVHINVTQLKKNRIDISS
ncbi:PREDICTED: contactin-associated protein-like 2, partial [Leptosomus discolor]